MAVIKAFECIRPDEKVADRVAALPYDVYNREEALKEVEREPLSFLAIDRAETQFDSSVDTYADCVYDKARELLDSRIADGTFITDTDKAYYVYELTMNGRTQTGIAACASIDDYNNNIIKKHENTRADKEQDRINHVDRCSAQTGPIFLAYRADEVIRNEVAKAKETKPLYSFTSPDGIRHQVYKISNAQSVENIEKAFAGIDDIYIADGHHRAASAVKVGLKRREEHPDYTGEEEFNYFLSVVFPYDQLTILAYNRVVKDLHGMDEHAFIASLKFNFELMIMPGFPCKPVEKHCMGMYVGGNWYHLKAWEDVNAKKDVVGQLDVSILQEKVLSPILGIRDPRTDERIRFVGGSHKLRELAEIADKTDGVAFAMYPTSMEDLMQIADEGKLMPPKSTWFEPKLRSGIFIHRL